MNDLGESSLRFSQSVVYFSGALLLTAMAAAAVYTFLELTDTGPGRAVSASITGTLVTLIIHFGLILAASIVGYLGRVVYAMTAAGICAVIAIVFWLLLAWLDHVFETGGMAIRQREQVLALNGLTFSIFAAALVHLGVFACLRTRSNLLRGLKWSTVAVTLITAVVAVTSIWLVYLLDAPRRLEGIVMPILIPGSLAALLGTIAVPAIIIQQNRRWEAARESVTEHVPVELTCPLCSHEFAPPTGVSHCPGCKTVLTVDLEEPRCECGYLLYRLAGSTCPECGRAIPEEQRWPRSPSTAQADTTHTSEGSHKNRAANEHEKQKSQTNAEARQ